MENRETSGCCVFGHDSKRATLEYKSDICCVGVNPLKTNGKPLYLKTQFVPRGKYFSSWL